MTVPGTAPGHRAPSDLPATVVVVGGGRMGAGITQILLERGCHVVVVETDDDASRAARRRITLGLERAREQGTLDGEVADVLARLGVETDVAAAPTDAELAIEAVPEDVTAKVEVLTRLEARLRGTAVLASNTSSLPIGELAAALERPERVLGLHFFNPVPISSLVEVIHARTTAPDVLERARGWVRALGRVDVVVADSPGFATSRLGLALGLEAIRMLEEGVADAATIDQAMELAYRHPVGPLRSGDLVGLDVRLAIAEALSARLGPRFDPPALLRSKVAAGDLGRKTGRGFFDWA